MTLAKNTFLLGIITIFIFSTCSNSDDDCIENRMDFTWSSNKSIEIDPEAESFMIGDSMINLITYRVIEGQDVLFEFEKVFTLCNSDIVDGIAIRKFSMIIPSDSMNNFSYTDQEILETAAYFDVFAGPSSLAHQSIEEGEIIGRKIDDNSWRISIEVVTKIQEYGEVNGDQPDVISVDTVFSLK